MADPIVPPVAPKAPAPGEPAAAVVPPVVEAPKLTGLDSFTKEQLQEFYKRSPQMFEDAGIVKKEVVPPVVVPPVAPVVPAPPPVSAAPKYGDTEIKLPTDVQVNREMVDAYLAHAKEVGLNAAQVQSQIDWDAKRAREAVARQPKQPTLEEIDAENVAKLKADPAFGKEFEKNMEMARRAAAKFGDPDLIKRMTTSDPVLVKHLWKIGQADAEDITPTGGKPRTGSEGEPEATQTQDEIYQKRYSNSPTMFKQPLRG